jgi:hypothetical protein
MSSLPLTLAPCYRPFLSLLLLSFLAFASLSYYRSLLSLLLLSLLLLSLLLLSLLLLSLLIVASLVIVFWYCFALVKKSMVSSIFSDVIYDEILMIVIIHKIYLCFWNKLQSCWSEVICDQWVIKIMILHKIYWRWMIQIIHKIYWRWVVMIIEDEWFRLLWNEWSIFSIKFIEDEWWRLLKMNDSDYP